MKLLEYSITFKNLSYFLNFGLLPEEQTLGQRIYIDTTVVLNGEYFSCEDDVVTVFDYRKIDSILKSVIHSKRYKLLEHLAKSIASEVLKDSVVKKVTISIRKPSVPISEVLDYAEVTQTYLNT